MIVTVQTHMQNDLTAPHACLLAASEDEIERLREVPLRQTVHVGRVPVVNLTSAICKLTECRQALGARRPTGMRQSLQVMLKNSIDDMNVIEDTQHDQSILAGQSVEVPADRFVEATIGPAFHGDELRIGLTSHARSPSSAAMAAGIKAHRLDPKLHRVLAEQVPRTGRLKNVEANIREGYATFKAYLEAHRDQVRAIDLDLAAFVCVTSIEALTHTAVLHYSDTFSDETFEALVGEATRLVVKYLQ